MKKYFTIFAVCVLVSTSLFAAVTTQPLALSAVEPTTIIDKTIVGTWIVENSDDKTDAITLDQKYWDLINKAVLEEGYSMKAEKNTITITQVLKDLTSKAIASFSLVEEGRLALNVTYLENDKEVEKYTIYLIPTKEELKGESIDVFNLK